MKDIKQYKAIMFMEKQIHKYGEATELPTVHSIINSFFCINTLTTKIVHKYKYYIELGINTFSTRLFNSISNVLSIIKCADHMSYSTNCTQPHCTTGQYLAQH